MKRGIYLLAALAALLPLAGCGSSGQQPAVGGGQSKAAQVVVETAAPGFDPIDIYKHAAPGVVTIRSLFEAGAAEGSGFVLDKDGRIVTNAHVVTDDFGGARKPAKAVFVEFSNRNVVPAKIVGFDPFADVALLEVKPDGFKLRPLHLGNDQDLVVGQPVAAIGSPFGEQQSLSVGIVSATNRSVKSLTQFQIDGAIQTDASINPGNSGGPLLNARAQVIGVADQINTSSGVDEGVGFAIPISAVKRSVDQLKEDGTAEYAYIGVSSQGIYPQLAKKLGLDTDFGVLIAEVVPGSPADKAGLKGGNRKEAFQIGSYEVGGDAILAVNGRKVILPEDLARYISASRPGDTVTLEILHPDNNREDVEVTLDKRPDPSQG